jgi:hypothetical protein
MTTEQVTRLKGWMFAMFGAGIASLITAYQYTVQPTGRGEPSPEFAPYLFGGIGIVCLIVAAVLARKTGKSGIPAAATDLRNPQGKTVIRLMAIGLIALMALFAVNFMTPDGDGAWLAASIGLLLIVAVCFVSAGCIARNIRRSTAAVGVAKE